MTERRYCHHCRESWWDEDQALHLFERGAPFFALTARYGDTADTAWACSVECMLVLATQAAERWREDEESEAA